MDIQFDFRGDPVGGLISNCEFCFSGQLVSFMISLSLSLSLSPQIKIFWRRLVQLAATFLSRSPYSLNISFLPLLQSCNYTLSYL